MKIALLTNFIPPYRRLLYQLVAAKVNQFQIFLSTEMESNRSWNVDYGNLNVKVQKSISYEKKWIHDLGYVDTNQVHIPYDTFFQLRKNNPDVVISSELGIRSFLSAIYCSLYKKKLILWLALSEHTESNKKGLRVALRLFILKRASSILCNGKSSMSYVASLGIERPFYFVPCSTDFDIIDKKDDFKREKRRFLYTGQLILRKGIKQMVEEVESFLDTNPQVEIELIVVGEGSEKVHFERLRNYPNLVCKLLGNVAYEEVSELYLNTDFYLFSTLGDEWGVVVNEALASGVPVIGSIYSQSVLELIEDDKNGWQYDPLEKGALSAILSKVVNTTCEDLQRMSAYGIDVIKEITAEKVADTIVLAINESMNLNSGN